MTLWLIVSTTDAGGVTVTCTGSWSIELASVTMSDGHRRRKEERLPLFGQQRKYPFDVVDETHVEHPVGFVEHEEADVGERDVSLSDQVEQAARRGDQQVDAALQGVHLRTLVDTAEDHAVAQVGVAGIVAAALVDLDRQFARGREHQRLDGAASFGAGPGREQLQDRQREGGAGFIYRREWINLSNT